MSGWHSTISLLSTIVGNSGKSSDGDNFRISAQSLCIQGHMIASYSSKLTYNVGDEAAIALSGWSTHKYRS